MFTLLKEPICGHHQVRVLAYINSLNENTMDCSNRLLLPLQHGGRDGNRSRLMLFERNVSTRLMIQDCLSETLKKQAGTNILCCLYSTPLRLFHDIERQVTPVKFNMSHLDHGFLQQYWRTKQTSNCHTYSDDKTKHCV